MKKLLKLISYILFFFFILIATAPKENIFFYAQEKLKDAKIEIYKQEINTSLFSISLNNFNIKYNLLDLGAVKVSDFSFYVFFNTLKIKDLNLDQSFSKFLPTKIKEINITYSILDPLNIIINSKGNFGDINGKFSLLDLKVSIELKQSDLMTLKYKKILNQMKKNKGVYTYEYKL